MLKRILRSLGLRKSIAPAGEISRRKQSIQNKETDFSRWEKSESFEKVWSERADLAASMVADYQTICDIGCGMQDLRYALRDGVKYLPMDVVKRSDDTIICEINSKDLPLDYIMNADATTVLGVVEYLKEPVWLLTAISKHCPTLLVSYCTAESAKLTGKRLEHGWMNAFTTEQFETLLAQSNWQVSTKKYYSGTQWLWLCHRTTRAI